MATATPNTTVHDERPVEVILAHEIQELAQTNQLAEYNAVAAGLHELVKRFETLPDTTTKEGYEFVKTGLRDVVSMRVKVDKERKRLKRLVDDEGQKILAVIASVETPLAAAKKAEDERQADMARVEAARIQAHKDRMGRISQAPHHAAGLETSGEVQGLIDKLLVVDPAEFEEFAEEAVTVVATAVDSLKIVHNQRLAFEREQVRVKAEAERQRDAQAKLDAEREAFERERAEFLAMKAAAEPAPEVKPEPEPEFKWRPQSELDEPESIGVDMAQGTDTTAVNDFSKQAQVAAGMSREAGPSRKAAPVFIHKSHTQAIDEPFERELLVNLIGLSAVEALEFDGQNAYRLDVIVRRKEIG